MSVISVMLTMQLGHSNNWKGWQILCQLVVADEVKQAWLHSAGILSLLDRLTLQRHLNLEQACIVLK